MAFEGLKTQMFRHSILETSTTQKEALGTLRILDDGRKFRYAKNGASALVAGNALQAPVVVAHHVEMAVVAAAAAGTKSVTVTLGGTAVTANQYAAGFLQINKADGIGHQYKILSHPAADAAANVVLTLEDPIVDALTTSSEASLIANPYAAVVVTTGATCIPVGVAPCDVAANAYFWSQTGGVACVETNGTPAAFSNLFPAAGGELDAGPVTTTTQVLAAGPVVGFLMVIGVDNEAKPAFLTLD
jgi:hypothetical protein